MTDIHPFSRDDLNLPCDVEPPQCSPYLLQPLRSVEQAARDILRRQLQASLRATHTASVVDLATARAARARGRG